MKKQKDRLITISPTEERVRLHLKDVRQRRHNSTHIQSVITRWLERAARRNNRHINEPSVTIETCYEPMFRQTLLYAYAYSFPDTLPDWLRTANIIGREKIEVKLEE